MRETPTFSNPWLTVAVAASVVLHLAVLYTPLNQYFGTVPLGFGDWGIIGAVLAVSLAAYLAVARTVERYLPLDGGFEEHSR
nr:cation-translocating P-type ATPase C-terminal domain-containing protein [Halobium salinum]